MSISKVTESTGLYVNDYKKTSTKAAEKIKEEEAGVVYEASEKTEKKATYSVNKMSAEDRKALVSQMKADAEQRQTQFVSMVQKMMNGQVSAYGKAGNIYEFLAKGDYTVDSATKLQAQKDIAEDGYYGVEQTSSRIFDFASALAGDDVDKMKEMQAAFEKGFKKAEKIWGGKLPDICYKTQEAVKKKFEDYYSSMETEA